MAVEAKRGCGFRKQGGLYLVSPPGGCGCDRLPIPLTLCPTCSHGFKQTRGFTWMDLGAFLGDHEGCTSICFGTGCPACWPKQNVVGKAGLIWIGTKYYPTPDTFAREATELGVSRRIPAIPKQFKVGETWVLLAHPQGIFADCEACKGVVLDMVGMEPCSVCSGKGYTYTPAIFQVWRPSRIEKILPESKRDSEEAAELVKRGITPVYVPDSDPDHMGKEEEDGDDAE